MTISPWPAQQTDVTEQLVRENTALSAENELLQESLADLELAMEDRGWRSLTHGVNMEFTPGGRTAIREACRAMAVSHPLIKRGLQTRIGYIWGQGVEITARVANSDGPIDELQAEVNALVDVFESANASTLTGTLAREELERALGTDGEVYLALFTNEDTGRVAVRSTPAGEVIDIITNPEDRDDPWYYLREYTVTQVTRGEAGGATTATVTKKTYHPALSYRPGPGDRWREVDGIEVRWDAPILHIPVNRLDGWKHGIPDAYASIAWARLYRDFLVDWAKLTKSLSRFAWKATGDTRERAALVAARERKRAQQAATGAPSQVGDTAVQGPGINLEAIPKTGATIDSDSGRPLAAMTAAGLGLPVTMLLADPGVTGARATAETLDAPTILEMGMRRLLWQSALEQILDHVAASAIESGRLAGQVTVDDWDRTHITLGDGVEPVWEFSWPPIAGLDPLDIVNAVVAADGTGKMPPLTTVRLLLSALGVPNVDDAVAEITDGEGRFADPMSSAGDAATEAHRRGEDPAARLYGE